MKLVALVALLLVLSYIPRLVTRLPPVQRKSLGRTILAVAAAAGMVLVFRHVGVIVVTLGALAYYFGSGGASQGFRQWLSGSESGSHRSRGASSSSSTKVGLTRAEALEVLGLTESATREEILAQYRVLMRKVHPDVPGGSEYLATRVNKAKEALLG